MVRVKAEYRVSLGDAFIIATAVSIGCEYLVSLNSEIKQVDGKLIVVKEPRQLK